MTELNYPSELKYSKGHQWINKEGVVGITDFAQSKLNDVVFVDLPEIGKKTKQNEQLCSIESVKSVSDVFAPVTGEVIEVNKELEDYPELVNKDCYGNAWIAKIKIDDKAELDNLMTAEDYEKFVSEGE